MPPNPANLSSVDLVYPTYLNTPMLVDFLATLDDGVSFTSDVAERVDQTRRRADEVGASIGLPNLASLLGLTLSASGKLVRDNTDQETVDRKFVREHTAASLFNRLRHLLRASEKIVRIETFAHVGKVVPGSIVECVGTIDRNPLEAISVLYEDARPYWFCRMFVRCAQSGRLTTIAMTTATIQLSRATKKYATKRLDGCAIWMKCSMS